VHASREDSGRAGEVALTKGPLPGPLGRRELERRIPTMRYSEKPIFSDGSRSG